MHMNKALKIDPQEEEVMEMEENITRKMASV